MNIDWLDLTVLGLAVALPLLVGAVLLALWGPGWWRALRRARVLRQPFPAAWRHILRQHMPGFAQLPADVQLQLKRHIRVLVAEKPFIGCDGLVVTDTMRVLVAAQASLLLLNRDAHYFPGLRQVLLYTGPFVVDRLQPAGAGLQREERRVLLGESWQQGQVILSWPDVLAGAAQPGDGHNVVIHEFAHQLDQETGLANGAPWLGRGLNAARWAAVMGTAFLGLQAQVARGEPTVLDPYAATDPAEFFAVASEVFFEQPHALAAAQPAVYAELAGLYRCDPRQWRTMGPWTAGPSWH
jgi:Mlc titration factor MtfA (ptsG expression regulator)